MYNMYNMYTYTYNYLFIYFLVLLESWFYTPKSLKRVRNCTPWRARNCTTSWGAIFALRKWGFDDFCVKYRSELVFWGFSVFLN